jgi:hypothetical protein
MVVAIADPLLHTVIPAVIHPMPMGTIDYVQLSFFDDVI